MLLQNPAKCNIRQQSRQMNNFHNEIKNPFELHLATSFQMPTKIWRPPAHHPSPVIFIVQAVWGPILTAYR